MGANYTAEEGVQGHSRRPYLDNLAARLLGLRMSLTAARERTKQQVSTGSVKDRIKFIQQNTSDKQRDIATAEIKTLEEQIGLASAKLTRQGAVLLPNGTIDWGLTSTTVVYDHTALAQGLTQLHPHIDGLLYINANHTTKFDTSAMVTAFKGRGWAIYVMSETGNLHASAHSVGSRHHSSLLAGASVAGAGEMRVLQGKLIEISNKSGHYAPAAAHFLQVFYVLQKRGVSLFNTKVLFNTALGAQQFASVAAFLVSVKSTGVETDFEFAKMMAYLNAVGYGNFIPLAATNGWRWGTPMDFALGSPAAGGKGVVRIADGTQVPARDVRKWLKTQGYKLGTNVQPVTQSGATR